MLAMCKYPLFQIFHTEKDRPYIVDLTETCVGADHTALS